MRAGNASYLRLLSLVTLMLGTGPLAVAQSSDPLPVGAQVRVRVPRLGSHWQPGIFNQLRLQAPCYRVLLVTPEGGIGQTLALDEVERLQVALRAGGGIRMHHPEERSRVARDERWQEVPLSRFASAARACQAYLDSRSARGRGGARGAA